MLYKKNTQKVLSSDLFRNPSSEYRGTPFWSWNCKMTPELLTKQIEYLKEMGFGGFHMHSRSGMDNAYMSDEFLGLIKACVDKAKKEDMLAWLYDEDRWPSGAAGGLVTANPRYRERFLTFAPAKRVKTGKDKKEVISPVADFSDEMPQKQAIDNGKPYFVGAYDVTLDENGYLISYERINRSAKAKGKKYYAFCSTTNLSDWYNNFTYVDTLDKPSIQEFIKVTHEAYKDAVGDDFNGTVPAIFTDEPEFTRSIPLPIATGDDKAVIAWTGILPSSFKKQYGEDIVDFLPEVFFDLPNGAPSKHRYHLHDHICQMFFDAFGQVGKWCDKNNLPLTGHMMEEYNLQAQTHQIGEAMRAYKYFGLPGIDMLCNRLEFTTAKQCQSVVHQEGKEGMLSELYGVTGWDFDFRGHKFQGDWQACLGVTIRVPHLSWVSMKGDAKRDYPASIFYQSPWYKEYPFVEDHFARLNTALTRGKPDISVAVIHPIESYWLNYGPNDTSAITRKQLEDNFSNVTDWLLYSQIDFNFISESLLPSQCKKASTPLQVGKMKYSTIIVPAMICMRKTTLDALTAFNANGGKIIFMGDCPTVVDGVASDEVKSLYEKSTVIPFTSLALVNALEDERKISVTLENGTPADNYIYQMRIDGAYKWLFICNGKHYNLADCVEKKDIVIKIKGSYAPVLYDTLTGETKPLPYTIRNGYTVINQEAYLHDSFLIRLEKTSKKSYEETKKEYEILSTVDFKGRVPYRRSEPNVLVLDIAEFTYDTGNPFYPAEEIRRLNNKVRKLAGIQPKTSVQPWCLPEEKPEHTVTLRFSFASEVEVEGAHIALEDAEMALVTFDGIEIQNVTDGYFTDESIKTIALPKIGKGKHTVTITLPLAPRTNIENAFILGEFGVRLEGCESTLIAPTTQIGFGSVVPQGLPFYGANLIYDCEVEVPEDGAMLKVHSNLYRGALISVAVDGETEGKIVYAPYDLITKPLKKGKHTVSFTLFGNRHNCFSALHNAEYDVSWIGPYLWLTEGDKFTYQYSLKPMGIISSPIISVIKEK